MKWSSVLRYLGVGLLAALCVSGLGFLVLKLIGPTSVPYRHEAFVVLMSAVSAGVVVSMCIMFIAYESQQITHRLRKKRQQRSPGSGEAAELMSSGPSV